MTLSSERLVAYVIKIHSTFNWELHVSKTGSNNKGLWKKMDTDPPFHIV